MTEAIIEPDLPIVDPPHHLWDLRALVPMFPDPRPPVIEAIAGAFEDFMVHSWLVEERSTVIGDSRKPCTLSYTSDGWRKPLPGCPTDGEPDVIHVLYVKLSVYATYRLV